MIADAIHYSIGGLSVAASFLVSVPLGITAWLSAATHQVPEELGDFGFIATAAPNYHGSHLVVRKCTPPLAQHHDRKVASGT